MIPCGSRGDGGGRRLDHDRDVSPEGVVMAGPGCGAVPVGGEQRFADVVRGVVGEGVAHRIAGEQGKLAESVARLADERGGPGRIWAYLPKSTGSNERGNRRNLRGGEGGCGHAASPMIGRIGFARTLSRKAERSLHSTGLRIVELMGRPTCGSTRAHAS